MTPPTAEERAAQTPDEKVVFEQTIEGLFIRGLGNRLSEQARERLREAGLDLGNPLLPAYEFERWMAFLRIAAEEVYPEATLEVAMFRLGERMLDGFEATLMGRALLAMIRLMGPARTLQRASRNFRSGNNYTLTKLEQLGNAAYVLWMNEVGDYPTFTAGIFHAGLRAAGAREIRVEPTDFDGHACTFHIEWR